MPVCERPHGAQSTLCRTKLHDQCVMIFAVLIHIFTHAELARPDRSLTTAGGDWGFDLYSVGELEDSASTSSSTSAPYVEGDARPSEKQVLLDLHNEARQATIPRKSPFRNGHHAQCKNTMRHAPRMPSLKCGGRGPWTTVACPMHNPQHHPPTTQAPF